MRLVNPRKLVHSRILGIACLVLTAGAPASAADVFPSKPIRIIVPAAVGGGLDATTRLVAPKMAEFLKQAVVVENRAGADTLLGTRLVKEASADGYTLLAQANGFTALPAMRKAPGYDPLKDFYAVGLMLRAPQAMFVSNEKPDRNVPDFIARAKAQAGGLSYASAGVGGPPHLGAALFLHQTGLDVVHVPYKGNGAAMPDVVAGRVDMIFGSYTGGASYVRAGKLKVLGVTGTERLAAIPDVPTFREQGVDFTYQFWLGLLAPAATPKPVIERLAEALRHATSSPDYQERMRSEGSEAGTLQPAQFQAYLEKEAEQMNALMRALGIEKE